MLQDEYALELGASTGKEDEIQCSPVHHSFGRGGWRELAKQVQLPRIALDSVTQQCQKVVTSGEEVGGAVVKMGGVPRECDTGTAQPKVSGRARALRLRTAMCVRRPGGHRTRGVCMGMSLLSGHITFLL